MRASLEKFTRLRDEKGVSEYKIAKATGITASTFSDWRSGRSDPGIEKISKLASYFGVPIEALLSEET